MYKTFPAHLFIFVLFIIGCKKSSPPPVLSAASEITSFGFRTSSNMAFLQANVYGTISKDSILVKVTAGTILTSLSPDIAMTGQSILPANNTPQNFTRPVKVPGKRRKWGHKNIYSYCFLFI